MSVVNGLTIFDDDHEFMKGFETGVMMRQKKSTLEDFGCSVPDEEKSKMKGVFDNINMAMGAVKPFLPNDLDIENGLTPEAAAQKWIDAHADIVKTWLGK